MAVAKRLRFEILRRDNHACRYCGATAPDVKLTVDHVVPVALGGSDEPGNLVAACSGCNSGKSSSVPDAPLVDDVAADALRWAAAIRVAAADAVADLEARQANYREFLERWNGWTFDSGKPAGELAQDWRDTVDQFLAAGLPLPLLLEAIDIAMGNKKVRYDGVWRYMCGVAWRRVTQIQESARSAVTVTPERTPAGEELLWVTSFPFVELIEECLVGPLADALNGDAAVRARAGETLRSVVTESFNAWKAAFGADYDTAYKQALEAGEYAAWPSLNAISVRVDDQGVR